MTLPESLLKRPAALIFDMDGTLLDTEPLYSIANQKVLDVYGVTFTMALKQECMGGDSKRSARIVIDHFGLPLSAEEYLAKREIHLLQLFEETPEIAGAANFIHILAKSGIPFGLATSSHQHLYSIKLADKVWGDMFHQVVCGDNKDLSNGKPAPDIFLLCAEKLGVDPKACIAFEDSGNGVAAARAAGMQVVAIDSPYGAEGSLDDAQLKISHYDEILPLLAEWQAQS